MLKDLIRPVRFKDYLLTILSALSYCIIAYSLERTNSIPLLSIYTLLFAIYIYVLIKIRDDKQVKFYIIAGILFRLILILAIPNLSDDVYRFIWDGRLWANGINPFSYLPSEVINNPELRIPGLNQALYEKLNSPDYFTIYPPVSQFVFWFSVQLSPNSLLGSVIVMRLCVLLAEIAIIFLLIKITKQQQIASNNILIYVCNPLVILELTGNLHFEVFMILFILGSIYFLSRKKLLLSAFSYSLAIAAKLIPLIFLPLFIDRLGIRRSLKFYLMIGLFTILLFLPMLSPSLISGMSNSISLYFQKFEFNASIYYLIREIGYWVKGYNIIQVAGKYLALTVFILVILFTTWDAHKKWNVFLSMTWIYFIYLMLATIVHPWYIAPLIALSIFTPLRFPVVWSYFIFFTYLNYQPEGYQENYLVVIAEYLILFGFIIYELLNLSNRKINLNHAYSEISYIRNH